MNLEDPIEIFFYILALVITTYYIFSLGKLSWPDSNKFKEILLERSKNHPVSIYNPKYDWNAIIWMTRVFSLVGVLILSVLIIGMFVYLIRLLV